MIRTTALSTILTLGCLLTATLLDAQKISEPFAFQFEQKTLRGLIEKPQDRPSEAIVILIPGYGRTDFVEGNWFSTLRNKLVEAGLTVCVWDKMGCGKSDGEFDALQTVENSADEAMAAIAQLKRLQVTGSEKIGLWGISRAGWICPLINRRMPIDFWISVSGTDDKENFGYLLKSNLLIAGKSEDEAEHLAAAWKSGHRLFCTKGDYENYLQAVLPLMQDSLCRELFGYSLVETVTPEGRNNYIRDQQTYTSKGHFDAESGLWVYLENFDSLLREMNCPVLALFGANDSQVNWRKTKSLYEKTIGKNPYATLSTQVFENCNHSLQKCISCAYGEDLSALNWQACDGYYEIMLDWLKNSGILD